jgi:type IV pilus assembly protein PilC
MAAFVYKVRDRTGKIFTGSIEGESKEIVISKLKEMDYFVTSIKQGRGSFQFSTEITLFQSVKLEDLTIFYRQFATMINAGLTIVKCLDILAEQAENKLLAKVLKEVKENIESGSTLAEAFSKHSKVFSNLYISMIKAGEIGGVLDEVLNRIADLIEKEYALRQKVKSAMTYPLFVLGAAVLMAIFLLIFILPQFATVFQSFGAKLPALTMGLITLTRLFNRFWYVLLIVIVALVFALLAYTKTPTGRMNFDKFKLKAPIFGVILRKTAIVRFTQTLSTLIKSGVPILQALQVSSESIGNAVVALAVTDAKERIKEGQSISIPLAESGVFPPMVTQMILVGEESGELENMLINIATFYNQEVERAVERLTSVIEPIMMAFISLIIGTMIIAMYLPIFGMMNLIE